MEIKGIIMVSPLMFQMELGQEGFLSIDAAFLIDNELFINTRCSVAKSKNPTTKHVVPIKRIGTGQEDFEIDFNIAYFLYNEKKTESERQQIIDAPFIIGPYEVEIETYRPMNYREQIYPKMDLEELITSLVATNELLQGIPNNETYNGDKKRLRSLIKGKLKQLPLAELKTYEIEFTPLSEAESQDGIMVNYCEDENILEFIINRIGLLQSQEEEMNTMSIEDLTNEMNKLLKDEKYVEATRYRDAINKRADVEK